MAEQSWEMIFREQGVYFKEPHETMPRVVELFKSHKVKKILDVCCGSGRHCVYLTKQGFEVCGFDSSQTALRLAREWLESEGLTAQLEVHDMTKKFPFKSGTFDAVIAINAIHHNLAEDVRKVVGEIRRVLKTGGIAFVTVPFSRDEKYRASELQESKYRKIDRYTYVPLDGIEKGVPHFYFENEEHAREFFNGFDVQEIKAINDRYYSITAVKAGQ